MPGDCRPRFVFLPLFHEAAVFDQLPRQSIEHDDFAAADNPIDPWRRGPHLHWMGSRSTAPPTPGRDRCIWKEALSLVLEERFGPVDESTVAYFDNLTAGIHK